MASLSINGLVYGRPSMDDLNGLVVHGLVVVDSLA